ncbi:hypothetical protein [Sorangium sp. So ce145]|uniref:hypothetical protein n=1 Tax=Sorangium sp. So ce145 TaxID=3133285 RepID=UPI003F611340
MRRRRSCHRSLFDAWIRAHEPVVLFGLHASLDVDIAVIHNPDPTGIVSIDDAE